MNKFKSKSVLITGAGGGIGLAVVQAFLQQRANVIVSDRSSEELKPARELADQMEAKISELPGDLSDSRFCDQLPEAASKVNGQLDIVINNAGIMRRGNILNTSDSDWAITMKVNVEAIFRICRAAIPILKSSKNSAIVNTSSCWGIYPGPDHVAYCTSKAAVAAMTKCLGRDHAADGIRINAVCPNEVNTPMLRTGFEIRGLDPDSAINTLNETVPLGRIAEPEDIAAAVVYLASDDARYVCGTLLEVNGAKPVY